MATSITSLLPLVVLFCLVYQPAEFLPLNDTIRSYNTDPPPSEASSSFVLYPTSNSFITSTASAVDNKTEELRKEQSTEIISTAQSTAKSEITPVPPSAAVNMSKNVARETVNTTVDYSAVTTDSVVVGTTRTSESTTVDAPMAQPTTKSVDVTKIPVVNAENATLLRVSTESTSSDPLASLAFTTATSGNTTLSYSNSTSTAGDGVADGNATVATNETDITCAENVTSECLGDLPSKAKLAEYGVPSFTASQFRDICSAYSASAECRRSLAACESVVVDVEEVEIAFAYLCGRGYSDYLKNVKCFDNNKDVDYRVSKCLKGYHKQMKEIRYFRELKSKKLDRMCTHTNYYVTCTSRHVRSWCNDVASDLVIETSRSVLGKLFERNNHRCVINGTVMTASYGLTLLLILALLTTNCCRA